MERSAIRDRPLRISHRCPRITRPQGRTLHPGYGRPYSPNTNSMVWLRISRSSGVNWKRRRVIGLSPDRIATYCLPPASNVIGGALNPVPTLIFQSGSGGGAALGGERPAA